ncbi:methyltransferase domain-containing protein [Nonlabens ulvanivorans]|uniref:methyltransferase domain-containing protein n=1 Tax=Nonlabens ulvanivorans TaxID=906888 RepID=UPI0037C7BD48
MGNELNEKSLKAKFDCYLCSNNTFIRVFEKDRNDEAVNNYSCSNCGFVMILPRLDLNQNEELYKNGKFSEEARGSVQPTSSKIRTVESTAWLHFQHLIENLSHGKIESFQNSLEIGCGAGSFLRLLKIAGLEVHGIEPDVNIAQYGIEQYQLRIDTGFFEDIRLDSKYDLISSFHVIEHVNNPTLFVKKAFDSLNIGGVFYLECPTLDNMYGLDEKFFFWKPHVNSFSDITLRYLLEKQGFKVLKLSRLRGFINIIAEKSEVNSKPVLKLDSVDRVKELISSKRVGTSANATDTKSIKYKLYSYKKRLNRYLTGLKNEWAEKKLKREAAPLYRFAHIGFHHSFNTGDIALFNAVRKQYEYFLGDVEFDLFELHNEVNDKLIDKLNSYDGVVIGGGGLFLRDTNANDISGWQWPIPKSSYSKFKVPLFIHAVGYNRFREQEDFIDNFTDNVNELVSTSRFVGLRNSGSINTIKTYLTNELKDRVVFQPCPTTMLDVLYLKEIKVIEKKLKTNVKKVIAFNIAFDRHNLRYGKQSEENAIMELLCSTLIDLKSQGYEVVHLIHVPRDEEFSLWTKKHNIEMPTLNLVGSSMEEMISAFKSFDLVVGTRGHAQMIPFGLDINIISLISHDKLKYFLTDINESERGVEIKSPQLKQELLEKINTYIGKKTFEDSKLKLFKQTKSNFDIIKSALNDS